MKTARLIRTRIAGAGLTGYSFISICSYFEHMLFIRDAYEYINDHVMSIFSSYMSFIYTSVYILAAFISTLVTYYRFIMYDYVLYFSPIKIPHLLFDMLSALLISDKIGSIVTRYDNRKWRKYFFSRTIP